MSVPGRLAAVAVFLRHGGPWLNVAIFEAICGVLVAGALGWESWGKKVKGEKKVKGI